MDMVKEVLEELPVGSESIGDVATGVLEAPTGVGTEPESTLGLL